LAFAAAGLAAAACVTTYEEAPLFGEQQKQAPKAVPVAIPFPDSDASPDEQLLLEFYGRIFERMQAAVSERDPVQLDALIASYDRPELPPRLRRALESYAAVALGMHFQQHAATATTITLVAPEGTEQRTGAPPVGAPLLFQVEIAPGPGAVRLGARDDDDPTGFAIAVAIDDTFVDGSTRSSTAQDFAWLPKAHQLADGERLRLPIEVAVPLGRAVRRVVHVRVDMMPGYVRIDGRRAPVRRWAIGASTATQWPDGYEEVAKAPLQALREAIRLGDPAHFPDVFVAAAFARGEERDQAVAMLIDQVRFGRPDQALVAMTALREATGENLPAADREAWLAWWQARR
jgi:hypothetical protein